MKRRMLILCLALAAVLALSACGGRITSPADDLAAPAVKNNGETVENWDPELHFSTQDADGLAWTDADLAGHLTMINYWAYWCGPCVSELPSLERLYETYADRGLLLLGVSNEEFEADNAVTVAETGVTYPCLRYTDDFDRYMNTGYIPTTIFVDANGQILGDPFVGSRSYEDWAAIVEDYLQAAE